MDAADEGTGSTVGVGSYAACVDDDDIRRRKIRGQVETALAQSGRDRFAVRPAGAASKVLDMVFCHVV